MSNSTIYLPNNRAIIGNLSLTPLRHYEKRVEFYSQKNPSTLNPFYSQRNIFIHNRQSEQEQQYQGTPKYSKYKYQMEPRINTDGIFSDLQQQSDDENFEVTPFRNLLNSDIAMLSRDEKKQNDHNNTKNKQIKINLNYFDEDSRQYENQMQFDKKRFETEDNFSHFAIKNGPRRLQQLSYDQSKLKETISPFNNQSQQLNIEQQNNGFNQRLQQYNQDSVISSSEYIQKKQKQLDSFQDSRIPSQQFSNSPVHQIYEEFNYNFTSYIKRQSNEFTARKPSIDNVFQNNNNNNNSKLIQKNTAGDILDQYEQKTDLKNTPRNRPRNGSSSSFKNEIQLQLNQQSESQKSIEFQSEFNQKESKILSQKQYDQSADLTLNTPRNSQRNIQKSILKSRTDSFQGSFNDTVQTVSTPQKKVTFAKC